MKLKVYLAHPISGLSFDAVYSYYEYLQNLLGSHYEILFPMIGKGYFRGEKTFRKESYSQPLSTNHAIIERDHWMVSLADLVLVDFVGAQATSIGCCMELAWAYHLHKHTVVAMDPGDSAPNPHQHAFVLEAADVVYPTLSEATNYLINLATRAW